jgi:GNAT superfamily N-acetyltransferase
MTVTRALQPLSMSTISLIPEPCRSCVTWELSGAAPPAHEAGFGGFEKEVWLSGVMLTWGSAGQIVTVDGVAAGYALYAPPPSVPGIADFPSGPVSPDAVLLTAVRILPVYRGKGLGTFLMEGVFAELIRRGVRAVEVFVRVDEARRFRSRLTRHGDREPQNPPETPQSCTVPEAFAKATGFEVVAPHHRYPRMRMELSGEIGWKADVEAALGRLFETIVIPAPALAEVGSR